ncbi:uncharacterized protein PFL1_04401 [Pseudozyma flocculosa PF-1]|uniref:Related to homocysteine S-methyltransferase n=2 Tax=Pseudozyma flocculosa TaxID=84751 RepID=A0A5C3FDH0_9BASI|nr:uncharacterized protein PFL1_04401 [Pseudozyma flocculosa PF-1]EPQ28074.1 hypothetical protein PFL1_04401 [Pseudozyma flocculosa PF-1]SPO42196.1 related to homocysteine S-methyltransferase [Pseudozyma flocculosa]
MTIAIEPLVSLLDDSRIGVLDGGLATYLEDGLGFDLSRGPLWSARLLDEQEDDVKDGKGRRGILDAHAHYIDAGAQIIGTATYQASHESFERASYSPSRANELMTAAVHIASDAISSQSASASSSKAPLISLSLGPYGAVLSNGAEYTGDYRPTYLPTSDDRRDRQPTVAELRAFHRRRLQTFRADERAWASIGVVALETVPRADEGVAFRLALEDLAHELPTDAPLKPVYVSYAFPDDRSLPWPKASGDELGTSDERREARADREMEDLLYGLLSVDVPEDDGGKSSKKARWPISGVGINCTKPFLIAPLADRMTTALQRLDRPESQGGRSLRQQRTEAGVGAPLLFLYPDGGLIYDAVKKVWLQPNDASQSSSSVAGPSGAESWADGLIKIAKSVSRDPAWSGVFVGGCCKSGTDEIRALCRHR